jgi:hypothetical protein
MRRSEAKTINRSPKISPLSFQFGVQPRPRESPITPHRRFGDPECIGNFLMIHADEITQLHDLRFARVLRGEFIESLVNGEHGVIGIFERDCHVLDVHALPFASVTEPALAAGAVNENAAHRFRGGGEEVGAVLPIRLRIAPKPEPGFMNERGGLKRLSGRFLRHFHGSDAAQFIIDEWEQFSDSQGIAVLRAFKNLSEVTHD